MSADRSALLAHIPGCARLDTDGMAALLDASRIDEYPPGLELVVEGEPAPDWHCVLETGAVQISRLDVESEEILDYLTAGDVLDPGTPGLPAPCSARVTEQSRCLLVPQSVVARHRRRLASGPAGDYRGDVALFVHGVADLVKGQPLTCGPDASVAEVARHMTSQGVDAVVVVGRDGGPIGIVTDRDLRAKVIAGGLPPTTPVTHVMSEPLLSIDATRRAFDALLEMTRRGIHHLGVVADGRLTGMVSSHDLVLLQGAHPVGLMREIDAQGTIEGLRAVAPRVHVVVKWLAEHGASTHDIGRIVAELNDRLVLRALSAVLAGLLAEGHEPPLPYTWLAAGSEGRREQTLKTDQDNGLVYQDPPRELAATAAIFFGRLASGMHEALVSLGFPPCEGGFMASNPHWCQPESVWRDYFGSWMETPLPAQLLRASIFFDLRPVGGDEPPGRDLCQWVSDRAPSHTLFQRHLARVALERHVPLGFFGGFVVERSGTHKDQLDLKARGVFPMTQAMRVCALSLGVPETNTVDRLVAAGARGLFTPGEVEDLRDGYEVISRVRLNHQLACHDTGRPVDNFIDPNTLRKSDRVLLKHAFKTLAWLQRWIEDRFQTEMVA
jgi:CBS domain-containing protein